MLGNEAQETERSLAKTNKTCKLICILIKIVFGLLCAWWLISISAMVCSLLNLEIFQELGTATPLALFVYVVSGFVMATICIVLIQVFGDASRGQSPFTMTQVKRLRIVSFSLIAYAILELLMNNSAPFIQSGFILGAAEGAATINLFPIVSAAVIYAFSFVFKYGVLLQKLSDETL